MGYSVKGKQGFQQRHGQRNHPLYRSLQGMKNRCYNPNCADYKNYGARGIGICEEWKEDFSSFFSWALENGWSQGLSIERVDCDKGYMPSNCKWVPMSEQSKNRRIVRRITYKGETHTIAEWARILNISRRTLSARIDSKNFTIEEAFEKPINKKLARR